MILLRKKKKQNQVTDWGKYLQNISDEGLVSRMHEELLKFNIKTSNSIK